MAIRLTTPVQVDVPTTTKEAVQDVVVTRFEARREPQLAANVPARSFVEVEFWTGKVVDGNFIVRTRETVSVTDAAAQAFLRRAVNGRLGVVLETEILSALRGLGKLGAGTVVDDF